MEVNYNPMEVDYDLTELLNLGGDYANSNLWKVTFGIPMAIDNNDPPLYVIAVDIKHVIAIVEAYQKDVEEEEGILSIESVSCTVITDPRSKVTKLGYVEFVESNGHE